MNHRRWLAILKAQVLTRILRQRPLWLFALGLGLAAVVGAFAAMVLVNDARQMDRDNQLLCEAINANSSTLRNLLVAARNQTPKDRLTPQARRFYRSQIAAIRPLDCSDFNRETLEREQERQREQAEGGGAPSGKPGNPP